MTKKICALLTALLVLGCLSAICFAGPATFDSAGKYKEVLLDKKANFTVKQDDEKIVFRADNSGYLHLDGKKSGEDYLSFIPNDKNNVADKYMIRELKATYPKMALYEIAAVVGDNNVGYWIVGKMKGQWKCFISYEDLYNMGMSAGAAHKLSSTIENGRLVLRTTSDGNPDAAVELVWNDSEKSFELNNH